MRVTADLHIHGRFSQATSNDLDIKNLEKYAKLKGVTLLGSGDFTHPKWVVELKEKLVEEQDGVYRTATGFPFILQTEISLIYSQGGKGRRIHNIVLAPNFDVVGQITEYLLKHGRVDYDGRPIFKIPCPEFVESLKKISDKIEVIPAHIWTPWFSLFGSMSGFDTVRECFGDQTKEIHALETGLSSDPAMNWRLSQLDKYALVSFSDLHSYWPWRIGREATIFDIELTYDNILKALRTKEGLSETIEVDPNYGKYHFDGHRNCKVSLSPAETRKHKGMCPVCGKALTIGVLNRVEELADRPEGFVPEGAVPFRSLIPLSEIISSITGKGIMTKSVWKEFDTLIKAYSSELNVLLDSEFAKLTSLVGEKIARAIIDIREGRIKIKPGYDGEYGVPIFSEEQEKKKGIEIKPRQVQTDLSDY